MNSFTSAVFTMVGTTVVGFGIGLAPAEAASIFTNQAEFLNNVQSGSYLETFDSLASNSLIASPIPFSQNGFSYSVSANPDDFYNAGSSSDIWLSSNNATYPIVFNFTSGNVSAVGGAFFPSDRNGNLKSGSVTLALSDGTTQTLTDTNSSSFLGFIANPGSVFTSLRITAVQPADNFTWPTVNNFRVGAAATAVPTPALLPGLIGLGLGVLRKRRSVAVEAND